MKWLEMIKLRTSGHNLENLTNEFIRPLAAKIGEAGLSGIQVYYHATLDTDLGIHIHWDTKQGALQKSLLGSCLVSTLEEFGLTYHTIWIPADGSQMVQCLNQNDKEFRHD